jgi:hypothetical protein
MVYVRPRRLPPVIPGCSDLLIGSFALLLEEKHVTVSVATDGRSDFSACLAV